MSEEGGGEEEEGGVAAAATAAAAARRHCHRRPQGEGGHLPSTPSTLHTYPLSQARGGTTAKAQEVAPPSPAPLMAGAGSSCLILSEARPHLFRFIATFE